MTSINPAFAYVLAQTKANIEFLRSAAQISPEDAQDILAKLSASPVALRNTVSPPLESSFSMPLPALDNLVISKNPSPKLSAASRPPPPVPSSFLFKARAIWGYNEGGKEPEDLQFAAGDIIEIIDDKNADWWKGCFRGKEGFFPSSYVESLRPIPSQPEKSAMIQNGPPAGNTYTSPYQYQQQPYHNSYYGPPPGQGGQYPLYNTGPQGPPPAPGAPVVIVNAEEPKKKPGFLQGKLGNTLAQSAVGGMGFGVGSAIGGDLIHSIF